MTDICDVALELKKMKRLFLVHDQDSFWDVSRASPMILTSTGL